MRGRNDGQRWSEVASQLHELQQQIMLQSVVATQSQQGGQRIETAVEVAFRESLLQRRCQSLSGRLAGGRGHASDRSGGGRTWACACCGCCCRLRRG